MAENTSIEWCDHTFNPWVGCTKVSPGCDHCYAEGWSKRAGKAAGVTWGGERRITRDANWRLPLEWNHRAEREGRRHRVFCASLADVFDNQVPPAWRARLFNLILSTPQLDWLLLTKRIGNAARLIDEVLPDNMKTLPSEHPLAWPWPHVWIGATVCNQEEADRDIPRLLAVPARVRFLSIEPMLGPVDLTAIKHTASPGFFGDCLEWYHRPHDERYTKWPGIDWVIVGAESGTQARPAHVEWVRNVVRQCRAAGVPVLVKQLGRAVLDDGMSSPGGHWPRGKVREPIPRATENDPGFVVRLKQAKGNDPEEWPEDLRVREFPQPRAP